MVVGNKTNFYHDIGQLGFYKYSSGYTCISVYRHLHRADTLIQYITTMSCTIYSIHTIITISYIRTKNTKGPFSHSWSHITHNFNDSCLCNLMLVGLCKTIHTCMTKENNCKVRQHTILLCTTYI